MTSQNENGIEYTYDVLIREFHLDTYGHVNNATYLTLYEEARWQLITDNGYGLKEIQEWGKGPVILDVQLKFLKELNLREKITIHSQSSDYSRVTCKIRQKMVKGNGDVASEAEFTFGLFDLKKRKLIPPTPEWLRAIGLEP